MRLISLILFVLMSVSTVAAVDMKKPTGKFVQQNNLFPKVKLVTSVGDIIVELDRTKAPLAVNNFLSYVNIKAYDNTVFHRLEPEFVVQGGGYKADMASVDEFPAVFNESGNGAKNQFGSIAMARNNDPHSATSQFFFNLNDNPSLDPGKNWGYTVFGQIQDGFEILEKMKLLETHTDEKTGWQNVPKQPIILKQVILQPEQ
ncbi:MAG TPA: peptidylprolyl isomerase [Rheinheimera sp.]|uniref:peptidylprolyl isomerase n=1 Tax=Rheinheimera sp. TaxID=1869214 RepID=UPI002B498010|nr:peptidylprolyl isomerase [Rheinheimera sp.]HJS15538.1 peptidylprolyl isomerase [Rheinheimera sp.]